MYVIFWLVIQNWSLLCLTLTSLTDLMSINVTSSRAPIMDVGGTAQLAATTNGINTNNYEYQWKKRSNGSLPDKVADVNGAVLTIPNLTESDEGRYYCIVTNEWGKSMESNNLTLTVKGIHTYIRNMIYLLTTV